MKTEKSSHKLNQEFRIMLGLIRLLKHSLSFLLVTFISFKSLAQQSDAVKIESEILSLEVLIDMALEKSISSLKATTIKENRYWQWRTFKSNYRPQLALEGVLPEFKRTINEITQPDGSVLFQPVANNNSFLNLSLSQGITTTGGEIFVNSQLQRFDDFDRNFTLYNGNPAVIGLKQPLFAYNNLFWEKKIEPLRYEESKKEYNEEMEAISYFSTLFFFDILQAQIDLNMAKKNVANNDTILKISQVKYDLGKISRGELLQLKLALKNSQKALAQAKLDFETAILQLSTYTGIPLHEYIEFKIPSSIPKFVIDEQVALSEARRNRQKFISIKRTIMEAESEVAKARGDNGLNATLFATFGLTNTSAYLPEIYQDVKNQQSVRVGFNIPIVDWGRSASRIKTAQANHKLAQYTATQDEIIFNQEINTQINQIEMLREQVQLTYEADQIATERYHVFKNQFVIGGITFTDLNIAQQEKDQATRDYMNTIRDFWLAYYNLRLLTLYDFEHQQTIVYQ